MKKLLVLLAVLSLIASVAVAEVDLSGMSFDELIELAHQVDQAIWASDGWQEVTVPPGTYKVGEDIPVGKWTIKAEDKGATYVSYCQAVDAAGSVVIMWPSAYKQEWVYGEHHSYGAEDTHQVTFECEKDMYIVIAKGNAIFTPYAGKPTLNFK